NIAVTLDSMGVTGEKRMTALEIAIRGALNQADSISALEEIKTKIKEMGSNGEISAAQIERLNDLLEVQKAIINSVTPGMQDAEDAMREFGITSQKSLQDSASKLGVLVDNLKRMNAP